MPMASCVIPQGFPANEDKRLFAINDLLALAFLVCHVRSTDASENRVAKSFRSTLHVFDNGESGNDDDAK